MVTAAQVRQQVEDTLRERMQVRLELGPNLHAPASQTGFNALEAVLPGGLPVVGTIELVGSRSSGRATLAAAYLAERTQEGHVCAWVDVSGDMTPEAGIAGGMDLDRVLWVRCTGVHGGAEPESVRAPQLPILHAIAKTPKRDKTIGTPGARNRPLGERVEQINSDRQPARRGEQVMRAAEERKEERTAVNTEARKTFTPEQKPWTRLEQAIKAVDLLVQGGGFGTIVLDLGGIAPQYARKIPLATWFRWRAALERTQSSLLVLSQMSLTGSSAELVLHLEAQMPAKGTVLTGVSYRMEVVRRRFAETPVAGQKKGSQRVSAWQSRALWA